MERQTAEVFPGFGLPDRRSAQLPGLLEPEVDQAWGTVTVAFDKEIRNDALRTIDRLIAEDYVSLPLFEVPTMWAYSDRIANISYQDYEGITWNANEWEISS